MRLRRPPRVVVRRARLSDAPALLAAARGMARPPGYGVVSGYRPSADDPDALVALGTEAVMDVPRWVQAAEAERRVPYLVLDGRAGEPAAQVDLLHVVRFAVQQAWLDARAFPAFAGTGRTRAGLVKVLDEAFAPMDEDGLGLHRLEAHVEADEVRAVRLLAGLGFRFEGVAHGLVKVGRRWEDRACYALTADEWG